MITLFHTKKFQKKNSKIQKFILELFFASLVLKVRYEFKISKFYPQLYIVNKLMIGKMIGLPSWHC